MELAEIRPFEPQMAEIDLFTMPDAVGVGEPSVRKVKPYISGHVTDGSSTFTFQLYNGAEITVPVDSNGNWVWYWDGNPISLRASFTDKTELDKIEFFKIEATSCRGTLTRCDNISISIVDSFHTTDDFYGFCNGVSSISNLVVKKCTFAEMTSGWRAFGSVQGDIIMKGCTFAKLTDGYSMFYGCKGESILLPDAELMILTRTNYMFGDLSAAQAKNMKNIEIKKIGVCLNFGQYQNLTAQSVVNLFGAVAADGITLTFHATVYAMIQAQLDIEDSPIYNAYWNSDYDFDIASA